MKTAEFKRQEYGAIVAQICETDHEAVEVHALPDGRFALIIHNHIDGGLWEDMSAILEPHHFEALGSIAEQKPLSEECAQIPDKGAP